jgi:transcriptional regulator with XRE-family HTH domain
MASTEASGLRRRLARNLKRFRRIDGLTQEGAAERLSMAPRQYQKLEAGETDINLRTLARLATALRVKAHELLE